MPQDITSLAQRRIHHENTKRYRRGFQTEYEKITGITIVVSFAVIVLILLLIKNTSATKSNTDSGTSYIIQTSEASGDNTIIVWNEITDSGVDEELLRRNVDTDILERIANNFHEVIAEEASEEADNPEIVVTEGWTRIFQKEKYKEVIAIGKPAMKPLYLILYK